MEGRERSGQRRGGDGGEREEEEAWISSRDMSHDRRLFTSRSKGKGCPSILSSLSKY